MFDARIYSGLFHVLDETNNHDNGISQSKIDDIHTKMKQDLASVKSEKLADIVSAYCDAAYLAVSEQEELMKNNSGLLRRIKPGPQAQADWVRQAIEKDFIIAHVIGKRRLAGKYVRPLEIYCRDNFEGEGGSFIIGPSSFGHVGFGGSSATFADPEYKMSFGYMVNKLGGEYLISKRCQNLIDASYTSLLT